jgi:hypothetical protein
MKIKFMQAVIAVAVATSLLGGCSTLKKFTGQRDDKILPGERENILPPDQQVNNDITTKGKTGADGSDAAPAPCDPKVEVCPGTEDGIDQEAGGN